MNADPEALARLEFALHAADEAAAVIMPEFSVRGGGVRFQSKADGTPVTAADVGAEERIRDLLSKDWGRDGVLGEECGDSAGDSGYRWVIDPIDGTKSFVHGVPLFGTLIAVQRREGSGWRSVAGVAAFPALQERVYGALGGGAWHRDASGRRTAARVSAASDLREATVCVTSIRSMLEPPYRGCYLRIVETARLSRGWSDCYGTMLLITGRIDAMLEPPMKLWDVAALEPILHEAGGRITGWDGEPTDGSTGAIESNGALHGALMALVREHGAAGRAAH